MDRSAIGAFFISALAIGALSAADAAPGPASPATKAAHAETQKQMPWADESETALASRGFLGTRSDPLIRAADGRVVFDLNAYAFLTTNAPSPDTANPSLWRHARLLALHGLFEVRPGLYQVRGFDIANITFIRGRTGWIIIDPLTTTETAKAARDLVFEKLGAAPIHAVLYTHSHVDHFGGVKGVIDAADVAAGRVQIIAPEGFLEHAVAENLIAGPAMSRRATYQFGAPLPRTPTGHLGAGIGPGIPMGSISLLAPTRTVQKTGETINIDGVDITFQVTPGTEAPAEMNIFFPQLNALCMAENANATLHNLLPPRGALVRDGKAWSDYLTEAIQLFAAQTDVVFMSHTWPRWGKQESQTFLETHRDAYKYLHDQSVRMMNQGLTASEIAERIDLPPELARRWYNRGYYGALKHNARAVYQRYLGWYDANPARLDALPPEEAGKRYVAALGGPDAVMAQVRAALAKGDYRWAAELGAHLIFAQPDHQEAKMAVAQAFEQMGYQAESMLWRNMYLTGAQELRDGVAARAPTTVSPDMLAATPTPMIFDLLAIRIDPSKAAGKDLRLRFVFPERNESTDVSLKNRVLVHQSSATAAPQTTITVSRANFLRLFFQGADGRAMAMRGEMRIEGDAGALQSFGAALDRAQPNDFAIVTP